MGNTIEVAILDHVLLYTMYHEDEKEFSFRIFLPYFLERCSAGWDVSPDLASKIMLATLQASGTCLVLHTLSNIRLMTATQQGKF